ncbi:hypothetical protein BgAZ_206040 [Babesia gibsoni]|uniref:Uncharacterized protein n=1 Tax=Babesia gibsoni TaxID=33632 RepID=A0AAD8LLF6_BABGI|nr:hypothetical protein BgAZ_206040 [Babesia gibsoni]
MVASTVLSILYEFLVAESRYEARGSEYRARLKAMLEDMLSAQHEIPRFYVKSKHASASKVLDEMVNCVTLVDCSDVLKFNLFAYPGIRQYAYPEIPEFSSLDVNFLKSWQTFFGIHDLRERQGCGYRYRRGKGTMQPEWPSYSSEEDLEDSYDDSESPSDSDSDRIDAVITADDILCPRVRPEILEGLLLPSVTETPETKEESAESDILGERYTCNRVPLYMDSTYKIDRGAIVFGLINDPKLNLDWSCNKSYSTYAAFVKDYMSETDFEMSEDDNVAGNTTDEGKYDSDSSAEDRHIKYEPNAIFGNYYCPLPKGYKPRLSWNENKDKKEQQQKSTINYTSFTPQAMEVTSTVYVGSDGAPRVSCIGTLGEKTKRGPCCRKKKLNSAQFSIQRRLEKAISGVFAIKNAISNLCSRCSGWSINNGCSIVFCESCEDTLINEFDTSVVDRLFELRRHLTSELYSGMGYKFVDSDAKKSTKGDCGARYITVPALCEIGGTYPKASMHDGRYVPNSMDLPIGSVIELSNVVYTNAELRPYAEHKSRILAHCRQRRKQKLQCLNNYLENLYQLYGTATTKKHFQQVSNDFTMIFKRGYIPLPNTEGYYSQQNFDDITSYVLYKLPLDTSLIRKAFYRRGAYSDQADGVFSSCLLELAEETKDMKKEMQQNSYQWKEIVLKYHIRKHQVEEAPKKPSISRYASSILKSLNHMEYLRATQVLLNIPSEILDKLFQSGRLEVGFPTSLEMHILAIPDAVLDPCMYSKSGMSLLFSLQLIMQNLCALSPFLKVTAMSNENRKRRAK